MNLDEAHRLDLVDQQHELADRLFMLSRGLTHYVVVSARERSDVLSHIDELRPWSEQDREEFETLRRQMRDITGALTAFDRDLLSHHAVR